LPGIRSFYQRVIDELAAITFVRDCGENNESVIACPASELPKIFPQGL
jgi:phenolic acid decarboxylase